MLKGERLDRIRDLAWRELELAEDEEILGHVPDDLPPRGDWRERRPSVPIRAITAEHEIPAA
jgi:hypothetical protein